jgi:hypothetical protein
LPGGCYRHFPDDIKDHGCRDERASKKRRAMTMRQFHLFIDELITELDLEPEFIRQLRSAEDVDRLETYVFPLYMRLRAEGFQHYPDLIA